MKFVYGAEEMEEGAVERSKTITMKIWEKLRVRLSLACKHTTNKKSRILYVFRLYNFSQTL